METQTTKAGYKQTDVGLIPEDWEVKTYDQVFMFLSTGSFSRADMQEDSGIQCVHYGDIHVKFDHFIDFSKVTLPYVAYEKAKSYPLLKNGDIVMADASEDYEGIGKSVEVKGITDESVIGGLHAFVLRDVNDTFVDGFRGYIHAIYAVKKIFDRLATGLKVFGLSKASLKLVSIPVPPIEEQKAIAQALGEIDDLIVSLAREIAKKQAIKQGAMQELLTGKRRLPAFDQGQGYQQTELGLIPEDWEVKNFGEICKISVGRDLRENNFSEIKDSTYRYPVYSNTVSNEGLYGYYDTAEYEGESLTVIGRGVGLGTAFTRGGGYGAIGRLLVLQPNENTSAKFLTEFFNQYINVFTESSGIPQLTGVSVSKYKAPLPPTLEEQKAIASILSDMDTEISELERKKAKYERIKQGMMQELLTGKTRLV